MRRALVLAAVAVLVWATPALASFTSGGSASATVSAHQLGTPTLSCGGLGILSVTLNWTAPADTTQADVYGTGNLATGYELLRGTTSGGPYPTVVATTGTTHTDSLVAGTYYYVVRTTKQQWKGPLSNQRKVVGVLFLLTTCS
jgi:hypothetical protein